MMSKDYAQGEFYFASKSPETLHVPWTGQSQNQNTVVPNILITD